MICGIDLQVQEQEVVQLVIRGYATKAVYERTCKKRSYASFILAVLLVVWLQVLCQLWLSVYYIIYQKLRTCRVCSFHYITLGRETIFIAFSRFGITVPGVGAEVQSM